MTHPRAISPRPSTPLLREVYGRLIRRRRHTLARTLADVAAEAGISMPYLSEIERGLKEPSSEVLAAVCLALGSSVTDLVGEAHHELRATTAVQASRATLAVAA